MKTCRSCNRPISNPKSATTCTYWREKDNSVYWIQLAVDLSKRDKREHRAGVLSAEAEVAHDTELRESEDALAGLAATHQCHDCTQRQHIAQQKQPVLPFDHYAHEAHVRGSALAGRVNSHVRYQDNARPMTTTTYYSRPVMYPQPNRTMQLRHPTDHAGRVMGPPAEMLVVPNIAIRGSIDYSGPSHAMLPHATQISPIATSPTVRQHMTGDAASSPTTLNAQRSNNPFAHYPNFNNWQA